MYQSFEPKASDCCVFSTRIVSREGFVFDTNWRQQRTQRVHLLDVSGGEVNPSMLGRTEMTSCVAMTCEINPLLPIKDPPLANVIECLDIAPFDDRRLLQVKFTADQAEWLIQSSTKTTRWIDFTGTMSTTMSKRLWGNQIRKTSIEPAHEYSDDEESDMPIQGFRFLIPSSKVDVDLMYIMRSQFTYPLSYLNFLNLI